MIGNTKLLSFLLNKKLYKHADVVCKHNKFYLANQWGNSLKAQLCGVFEIILLKLC